MATKRIGDLQIQQDLVFSEREWRVQRAGWLVMLLLILLALAGLFGRGPVADAALGSAAGPFQVSYERFDRAHYRTELLIEVSPPEGEETVEIWVGRTFLDAIEVNRIVPEPDVQRIEGDRVVFVFATGSVAGDGRITVSFEHNEIGPVELEAGIVDGPAGSGTIFVFP